MRKSHFNELLASVAEAKEIAAGRKRPSRSYRVALLPDMPPAPPPKLSPQDIRRIRARSEMSIADFASVLGISARTVENWEAGATHPGGMALRLLSAVRRHGLGILA